MSRYEKLDRKKRKLPTMRFDGGYIVMLKLDKKDVEICAHLLLDFLVGIKNGADLLSICSACAKIFY